VTADPGSAQWSVALDYILGRKRAEESLGFLRAVTAAVLGNDDGEQLAVAVAALAVPLLGDSCGLYRYRSEVPTLLATSGSTCTPQPIMLDRVARRASAADPTAVARIAEGLLVPMRTARSLVGCVALERTDRPFDRGTIALAEEFATRVAYALAAFEPGPSGGVSVESSEPQIRGRGSMTFQVVAGADGVEAETIYKSSDAEIQVVRLGPDRVIPAHTHPFSKAYRVTAGSGELIGDAGRAVCPGDVGLLEAGTSHGWRAAADGLTFYSFILDGNLDVSAIDYA
jgi:quercetin dioxygenase-like cupin family protein